METKNKHIDFWLTQADYDWTAVETLFNGNKYLHSLFFAHLVIEKIYKAIWIKNNDSNIPPKTHNLIYILSFTPIELNEEKSEFLLHLNRFQLEGRYPDYFTKIYDVCNETFTRKMLNETNKMRLWLLKKVQ